MQPHAKYKHVFVVCRIDTWFEDASPHAFNALKVYADWAEAEAETERLNKLNAEKQSVYVTQSAHWIPSASQ